MFLSNRILPIFLSVMHFLFVLEARAASLNRNQSLEVTCGLLYSVGAYNAYGGWPQYIHERTGDTLRNYILHLHYAPFVRVHNPGTVPVEFDRSDGLPPVVRFNAPPLALRFERLSGATSGFMSTGARPIINLHVFQENFAAGKIFRLYLSMTDTGPIGMRLEPGETKIFVPRIPPNHTWDADQAGEGNTIFDWRNDKTSYIECTAEHGWRGAAYAYSADWLAGVNFHTPANGQLGVISSRWEDTWNVYISKSGESLKGARVYQIPETPSASWPMEPLENMRIESFPIQTKNMVGVFSTSEVYIADNTQIQNRTNLRPVFSVLIPYELTTINAFIDTDNDGIDDDWERIHFGNLAKDGSADSDGDGDLDSREYLTGSLPNDKNDKFVATLKDEDGELKIQWSGTGGRIYEVQESTNLKTWTTIKTWQPPSSFFNPAWGKNHTETLTPPTHGNAYYRVRVRFID